MVVSQASGAPLLTEHWSWKVSPGSPQEFVPAASQRIKEIKEAARKGQDPKVREFNPVAHLQKMKDVKAELEKGEIANALISKTGIKKANEGFMLALKWILHLDPLSVEDQKAKWEENEARKAELKKKKAAERAAKKVEKKKKELEEATAAAVKAEEAEAAK